MRICNHCWEPGHPSRLCPERPGRRQSTIRPIRAPTPAPPAANQPSPSPEPPAPILQRSTSPPIVTLSPSPELEPMHYPLSESTNVHVNGGSDPGVRCANCGHSGHGILECPYDSLPSSPTCRALYLQVMGQQPSPAEASDWPIDESMQGRDPNIVYNSDAHDGLTD